MTTPGGTLTTQQPITMAPGALNQANVEFVNPKFREEYLSRNEAFGGSPSSTKLGETSSNNPDNPWLWLNAYSRIPVSQHYFKSKLHTCFTVDAIT